MAPVRQTRDVPVANANSKALSVQAAPGHGGATLFLLPFVMGAAIATWHTVPLDGSDSQSNGAGPRAHSVRSKIDPDVAPWWELTALPRIGEVTAKRIVEYREATRMSRGEAAVKGPVFPSASDLQNVHGIGPKTAGRIAEFLDFDRPAPHTPSDPT